MIKFDISRDWLLLVPPGLPAALAAGTELSRIIGLLRNRSNASLAAPPLADATAPVDAETPVIVLNAEAGAASNGYSWRLGLDRIELYGASERGLCNGVYDFLSALNVSWPGPGEEKLPDPPPGDPLQYPLKSASAYQPAVKDPAKKRRIVFTRETPLKNREALLLWAIRNRIDAVVLPLWERKPAFDAITKKTRRGRETIIRLAKQYSLSVEAGGWDLSLLVSRRYYFSHREIFRMEQGRRIKQHNFCPTSPETIALLKKEARRYFGEAAGEETFHLWPDRGAEQLWCSCPSCRAFSREEQNRIAVNTAADVLAELNLEARISYYENAEDPDNANPSEVAPRPNMFSLPFLPGQEGAEKAGLFLS